MCAEVLLHSTMIFLVRTCCGYLCGLQKVRTSVLIAQSRKGDRSQIDERWQITSTKAINHIEKCESCIMTRQTKAEDEPVSSAQRGSSKRHQKYITAWSVILHVAGCTAQRITAAGFGQDGKLLHAAAWWTLWNSAGHLNVSPTLETPAQEL